MMYKMNDIIGINRVKDAEKFIPLMIKLTSGLLWYEFLTASNLLRQCLLNDFNPVYFTLNKILSSKNNNQPLELVNDFNDKIKNFYFKKLNDTCAFQDAFYVVMFSVLNVLTKQEYDCLLLESNRYYEENRHIRLKLRTEYLVSKTRALKNKS